MKRLAVTRARPVFIEPKFKVAQSIIDRLVTLDPKHPDYPLTQAPFEIYYEQLTGQPEDYQLRHSYAVALLSDPQDRYPNPRFLAAKFVPKGTDMTPEIQALNDDLKRRVREALRKRREPSGERKGR